MPIAILRPNAIGDTDEWTLAAGATKYAACDPGDPVSHDEDTTRCSADAGGGANDTQDFKLTAMPGAATGIRGVVGKLRWRTSNDNNQQMGIRAKLGGVLGTETAQTLNSSGSYTDFTVDPFPRPNGGSWTLSDLADSTMQIEGRAITNPVLAALRITSFWLEVDYIESAILPYDVQTGSFRVVFFSNEIAVYKLKVHHKFLINENVIDLMSLTDQAFPVSSSVLTDLSDHGLLEKWRRKTVIPVAQSYIPSEHVVEFTFIDYEPIMATYFSTLTSPFGTLSDTLDGVARFDPGATWTVDRGSVGYVNRESQIVQNIDNSQGYWLTAPDGREKINYQGLLTEDAATNKVLNSAFAIGTFTNWTNVLNGGSFSANTQKTVFPDDVTLQSFDVSRANDANDSYTKQSIAVISADSFRRVSFIHSEDDTTSIASIAIQRDFDNKWWNDATPAWQVSKVWLNAANSYDSTNSLELAARLFTEPIPVDQDENWLIQVGMEGSSLPAGGGDVRIYHVQCTVGKLRYSPIPTKSTTVTTSADSIKGVLSIAGPDPVRQMHYAGRGTIAFKFLAEQNGGDLVDASNHALVHVEYGTTPGDDYDTILYQKLAGQNVRFTFERYISGVLDARALKDTTIVKGTTYDIRALATSDSDGELGLSARTMRILIDDVAGTDGAAGATHSTAEKYTELWVGSAPSATGYSAAMNKISRLRLQQRVVPIDEKIL